MNQDKKLNDNEEQKEEAKVESKIEREEAKDDKGKEKNAEEQPNGPSLCEDALDNLQAAIQIAEDFVNNPNALEASKV